MLNIDGMKFKCGHCNRLFGPDDVMACDSATGWTCETCDAEPEPRKDEPNQARDSVHETTNTNLKD